jgi:hypothetical protein
MEDVADGKAGSAVVVSRISRNNTSGGLLLTCREGGIGRVATFFCASKDMLSNRHERNGPRLTGATSAYCRVCSDQSPRDGTCFLLPC